MNDRLSDIEKIQAELEYNDILSVNIQMKSKAMSLCDDGNCIIAVDESQCESSAEIKTTLLHEQGHCETYTFYSTRTPFDRIEQLEYRADKYVAENKITKYMIIRANQDEGLVEAWEFAEYFGVTVGYMKRLMWIHFQMEFMD